MDVLDEQPFKNIRGHNDYYNFNLEMKDKLILRSNLNLLLTSFVAKIQSRLIHLCKFGTPKE